MIKICPKIFGLFFSLIFFLFFFSVLPNSAFASNFTVSNLTYDSSTGHISFDYSGVSFVSATNSIIGLYDVLVPGYSVGYSYLLIPDVCTSSHCDLIFLNLYTPFVSGDSFYIFMFDGTEFFSQDFVLPWGSPTSTPTPTGSPTSTPTPPASDFAPTPTVTAAPEANLTPAVTTIVVTSMPTPTPIPLKDTIAPVVWIDTDLTKPFLKAPKIAGTSFDKGAINAGVAKVEYSIDDGKNWLPADNGTTSFDFTPVIFEDGNYKVIVLAIDNSGNIGYSKTYTLVIDRLPPQVGGVLFSLGPQILVPTNEGIILTLQGLDTKITLSAVGGPLTIDILSGGQMYSLSKNIDNGLWSGVLNFDKPGIYELTAKAIDGAENRTERKLNTIVTLNRGIVSSKNSPVTSGTATLWYFDNQTQRFVVWDGLAYGQENPQPIGKNGEYGFIAPSGKYYLEVKSYGFKTLRTEIFTLNASMPITTPLKLVRSPGIQIGPFFLALPDFSASKQSISIQYPIAAADARVVGNVIGSEFPNVNLFLNAEKVTTISFQDKPSVFTFLSTWSPYTPQQLSQMEGLSGNSQINVLPVISQETASSVAIFQKRGGYSLSIMSDPDGLLVKPLGLSFLPTHVFVNRKGIIQGIKVGVLTKDEILQNMVY